METPISDRHLLLIWGEEEKSRWIKGKGSRKFQE